MARCAASAGQLPGRSPIGWAGRPRSVMAGGEPGFPSFSCLRMRCRRAFQPGASWAPVAGPMLAAGARADRAVGGRRPGAGAVPSSCCLGRPGTISALGNDAPVKVVAASGKALIRRMGRGEGAEDRDRVPAAQRYGFLAPGRRRWSP
ncbi:Hypothetical Protein RSSE_p0269 (plasmid) [Ralstonia solanacearum]|nr:Hypothetical Protein RSSE_p0269 [Ralstonia solanacearum]